MARGNKMDDGNVACEGRKRVVMMMGEVNICCLRRLKRTGDV